MEEGCGERRDEMKGKRRGGRKSLKTRREEMGNKSSACAGFITKCCGVCVRE